METLAQETLEETFPCQEEGCDFIATRKNKGIHKAYHVRMANRERKEQDKRYTAPEVIKAEPIPKGKKLEFELYNVITINEIDYPPTIQNVNGRDQRIRPSYYIGQKIDTVVGRIEITKGLMNTLTSRDSLANEKERDLQGKKKVSMGADGVITTTRVV
jgi:hypothetical protein